MQKIEANPEELRNNPIYFHDKITNLKFSPGQTLVMDALKIHKAILVIGGRRFGKTKLHSGISTWFCPTRPEVRYGYFAPEWEQCREFMDMVYSITDDSILNNSIKDRKKLSCTFTNGSAIHTRSVSATSQSGRGKGFDFLGIDESGFIPDELMAAVLPTGLVGEGWELQTSNPANHNHFYRDATNEESPFKIFHFKSTDNPFVNKSVFERMKKQLPSWQFKQEVEAEFIDDEFSAFPSRQIDNSVMLARKRGIEFLDKGLAGHNYYGGVDLGRKRDNSVIVIVDHNPPFIDLVYREVIVPDGSSRYWDRVLKRIEFLTELFFVKKWKIDQTTLGDKPTLDLQNTFMEKNIQSFIEGFIFSNYSKNSKDGLVNSLILQFERNLLAIPFWEDLLRELKNIRRKVANSPTRDIISTFSLTGFDRVTALALAVSATPIYFYRTDVKSVAIPRSPVGRLAMKGIAVSYSKT
jgi:phage FluMu gp28-like protein